MDRQTNKPEGSEGAAGEAVAERFRTLVKGWMAEDPAHDREAWPELEEVLDRNRPEYRKHRPRGDSLRA